MTYSIMKLCGMTTYFGSKQFLLQGAVRPQGFVRSIHAHRCMQRSLSRDKFVGQALKLEQNRMMSSAANSTKESLPLKMVLIGTVGGFAGSLVGLGGGFVTIPMLVAVAKFSQHQATATSLASVAATSFGGALTFWWSGNIDVKAATILAIPAIVTVGLGARFSSRLDSNTLKLFLGVFMMCVAPLVPGKAMLFKDRKEREESERSGAEVGPFLSAKEIVLGIIGGATGFASGLFGVGGGSIMTPAIALCTDMSQHSVIGTSLAAMFIPSILGTFQHYQLGHLRMTAAVPLAIGTCTGAMVGGKLALSVSEDPLRVLFGVLMLGLGFRQARAAWLVKTAAAARNTPPM